MNNPGKEHLKEQTTGSPLSSTDELNEAFCTCLLINFYRVNAYMYGRTGLETWSQCNSVVGLPEGYNVEKSKVYKVVNHVPVREETGSLNAFFDFESMWPMFSSGRTGEHWCWRFNICSSWEVTAPDRLLNILYSIPKNRHVMILHSFTLQSNVIFQHEVSTWKVLKHHLTNSVSYTLCSSQNNHLKREHTSRYPTHRKSK